MPQTSPLGKPHLRPDALAKASGRLAYPSDVVKPGMLWVQVLRSAHAHARIVSIDTSAAEALPGVACVLTAKDVPGQNGFGLIVADQPVLCGERVLHFGDAVAVVAAETDDLARQARALVRVVVEPLPVLTDARLALDADAPLLHPQGNLCAELHLGIGDTARGFAEAAHVYESEYVTGRQEHAFLEVEAGVAYYDDDGLLTLLVGGQNPFNDRRQVCKALGLPPEQVRVFNPMMGGAFGGKEDINVQIHLALVTQRTGRPCRLRLDREESLAVGVKRHPFHVRYKTGVRADGTLAAIEVTLLADTGPYTTLGPAVLGLASEHACGPYRWPHAKIDAQVVYTNNTNSSAFRGFGNPQVAAGLEQHMDMLARALNLDPVEFRLRNLLRTGEVAGPGFTVTSTLTLPQVLTAAAQGQLYTQREAQKAGAGAWKQRGVGLAGIWQGFGLGAGTADAATVRADLTTGGRYQLHVSAPDLGQGSSLAFLQLAAHELNCAVDDLDLVMGDTLGPNSGSSNASRSVFVIGGATGRAAAALREQILAAARRLRPEGAAPVLAGLSVYFADQAIPLAELAAELGPLSAEGYFTPQSPPHLLPGLPHVAYGFSVQLALVEVDTLTGELEVLALEHYLDAGRVIDPVGAVGQSEGALAQGLGYTLMEDTLVRDGRVLNPRLSTYLIPSIRDVPLKVKTVLLEEPEPLSPYGTRGLAEIGLTPTAPAILNAVYDAVGVRFDRLPVTPEMVLAALEARETA